jgi:CRP-like cAMP-binding protein
VYPKDEYIIRINEIAQEMYFIIQGKVCVKNAEGKDIFLLEKG